MGEEALEELASRLHSTAIRLLRTVRREDDASGLSAPRLSAVSVIVFAGPLTMAELASAEQVRPPTMTRIVEALVAAGLAERVADAGDRRIVRVRATEKGTELLHEGRRRRVAVLAGKLRQLGEGERRALERGVELMARLVG
jgi:DNA-binding MarR family transcriptional regulator